MRVLIDANILVSYLLRPSGGAIAQVMEAAIMGRYDLLLPEELLDELIESVSDKPYLAQRITPEDMAELVAILKEVAELTPRIEQEVPAVTRDPKDDYLLAHALVGQADYLVTGDGDLLALQQVGELGIVTPRALAEMLGER